MLITFEGLESGAKITNQLGGGIAVQGAQAALATVNVRVTNFPSPSTGAVLADSTSMQFTFSQRSCRTVSVWFLHVFQGGLRFEYYDSADNLVGSQLNSTFSDATTTGQRFTDWFKQEFAAPTGTSVTTIKIRREDSSGGISWIVDNLGCDCEAPPTENDDCDCSTVSASCSVPTATTLKVMFVLHPPCWNRVSRHMHAVNDPTYMHISTNVSCHRNVHALRWPQRRALAVMLLVW